METKLKKFKIAGNITYKLKEINIYADSSYNKEKDYSIDGSFIELIYTDKTNTRIFKKGFFVCEKNTKTNNNKGELNAIYLGLKALKEESNKELYEHIKQKVIVNVYSDSKYCVNGIKLNEKRYTLNEKYKSHINLFKKVIKEINEFSNISIKWIKGHSNNKYNRLIDEIVKTISKNI